MEGRVGRMQSRNRSFDRWLKVWVYIRFVHRTDRGGHTGGPLRAHLSRRRATHATRSEEKDGSAETFRWAAAARRGRSRRRLARRTL